MVDEESAVYDSCGKQRKRRNFVEYRREVFE